MTRDRRKVAFLIPVRVMVDAEGPAEAFATAWKYLNQNDVDNPIADATVGTPVQLPDRLNLAITAGTYRDGDAARWHDQSVELATCAAIVN